MKPTLNEEIVMSRQGIDYVDSLEAKEVGIFNKSKSVNRFKYMKKEDADKFINKYISDLENDHETFISEYKNNLPDMVKEIKKQRIQKQARNAWICVAVIILVVLILNWK